MPLEIDFREQATDDLERLYDHIAEDDPGRARAFVGRIRDRCNRLADFPDVGRRRDDLRPNLRLVAFERRVVIGYAFDATRLRILRIFYGGRDVERLLADGAADD